MIALVDGDIVEKIGTVWETTNGYLKISIGNGEEMLLHRFVAEQTIGRKLTSSEHVHHINENKQDNRRQNLLVCSNSYHQLIHARQDMLNDGYSPDRFHYCSNCKSYLEKHLFPKSKNAWNGVHNLCKTCSNLSRRGKGYGKFDWKERMHQQVRRAVKRNLASSLVKGGRSL